MAKGFRQERAVYNRFRESNQREYRVRVQQGLIFNSIFPIMDLTAGLMVAALAYVGGLATRGGGVSPGDWYIFMQGVQRYLWPLMSVASFWSQFQLGLAAGALEQRRCLDALGAGDRLLQNGADIRYRIRICSVGIEQGANAAHAADLDAHRLAVRQDRLILVGPQRETGVFT